MYKMTVFPKIIRGKIEGHFIHGSKEGERDQSALISAFPLHFLQRKGRMKAAFCKESGGGRHFLPKKVQGESRN